MQIHEITVKQTVNEGLMDQLKLAGKAFNDPSIATSNSKFATAQADIRLQNATKDFAKRLASEWVQQGAQIVAADAEKAKATPTPAQPKAAQPAKPTAGTVGARAPATQPSGIPSTPTKPGGPGQMSQTVAGSKVGQRMQQMYGKPKGGIQGMQSDIEEAFGDLPGAKPAAGGAVDPRVTAVPKTIAIPTAQRNSKYAQSFQNWVKQKLTTRESGTGTTINMDEVLKRIPGIDQKLKTALTSVYTTRNDPKANQTAVENYLTIAATGFQQAALQMRKENPERVAARAVSPAAKKVDADPQTQQVLNAIGMADTGLDTLARIVKDRGESITSKTGSNTVDRLLTAAGLV